MWEVYTKGKYEFINREFPVDVLYLKEGGIIWTCGKYNHIKEEQEYKAIRLGGFDYKLFEKQEGGCVRKVIFQYP